MIGKSTKYENLVYNFGITDVLFDDLSTNPEGLKLPTYIKASELTSKIVLDQIGIEKFTPSEDEK